MGDNGTTVTHTSTAYADTVQRWSPVLDDSVVPHITTIHLRKPFSIYLRVMDSTATWSGPLWQVGDEEGGLACRLSGGMEREQPALICELWTDYRERPVTSCDSDRLVWTSRVA